MQSKVGQEDPKDPLLLAIGANASQIKSNFENVTDFLGDYDERIVKVLAQHEEDFLYAYKMHMVKIEKELQYLKLKAREQDAKLTQDARIVSLEKQLKWFEQEFNELMQVKERNEQAIEDIKGQCKTLVHGTNELRSFVKAQQRHKKLLNVALSKAKHQKTDLHNLSVQLEEQKSLIQKHSVEIPSLMYSPFLPLN